MKTASKHAVSVLVAVLLGAHLALSTPSIGLLDRASLQRTSAHITRAAFPDADDVLVDDHTRIIYAANGTWESLADTCVKVLTDKGARDNRTLSIHFNVSYGTAMVELVELLKPDGRIIPVNLSAQSRITIDDAQMNKNIFDPQSKVLHVSIPGLEPGDLCRYVVRRITTKARMPDTFSDYTLFELTSPILHSTYEIWGPTSRPLVHLVIKAPVSNTVVASMHSAGGTNFYLWKVRNVPRMFPEPNMPALHTVVQRLLVSTIPDWATVSRWYHALCAPRLAATTPAMSNFVAELTAGLTNDRARLEALFYYVSQNIRYMGITTETEAPGYEPHDVCVTFENKYGVCRDKGALLVALLRLAGFKAYPVLMYIGPKKDPEVPQPFFNHAVVAVEEADGSYTLMDPTDETTKELLPAYLCDRSYLVAKPAGDCLRVSPIIPAEANMMRIKTTGELSRDGTLRAQTRLSFDGINDNAYRSALVRMKPIERRHMFEGLVKRVVPGARILACEITPRELRDMSKPLHVHLTYEAREFPIVGPQVVMLPPLWFGTSVGLINFVIGATGLDERKYPLETKYACGVSENIRLTMDGAAGPVHTLPHIEAIISSSLVWQAQMTVRDGVLHAHALQQLRLVEFSPQDYRALKDALRSIEFDRRKRAIFAREADPSRGDVVIHDADELYEVHDAHTQRVLTRVKKQILTYAGKKQHAELKVPFNPVWDTVTLHYARVTTPDGRLFTASTNEINYMDAPWVGRAPRYPGEKILVVNLPGVEIGSTIEYCVERTQRHRPSCDLYALFRTFDPIQRKRVRCRVPLELPFTRCFTPGGQVMETIASNHAVIEYTWEMTNQPPITPEPNQPPLWMFAPGVVASCGTWKRYAAEVHAALLRATEGQTAAIARAQALTAGLACRRAKIRAVRDFIATHIRAAGPPFPAMPLTSLSPADRTLHDGYGHSADRAILYLSMLRAIGVTAEFVLASSEPRLTRPNNPRLLCPQRHVFPTVLVRVLCGAETWYLNDTDQYAELGVTRHDGRPALLLPAGTLTRVRAPRRCRSHTELFYDLSVDEQGDARLTYRRVYYGTSFGAFRKQYTEMTPEQRRRHYLELVANISQAARAIGPLHTQHERYPGVEEFTVHVPRYLVRDGTSLYGTLPAGLISLPGLRADTRSTPYYWDSDNEITITTHVHLPTSFAHAELLPPTYTWYAPQQTGFVRCSAKWHCSATNLLPMTQDLRLRPAVFPPDTYPALLDANHRLTHASMRTILLSSSPSAP
ncbi:MAG: DUF3857 domain-containing protein [bacterium]|nr:DUF3857 domain-containing protein [bacterium]